MQGAWVQSPVGESRSHVPQLRAHILQLKIPRTATKTCTAKEIYIKNKKKKFFLKELDIKEKEVRAQR